MIITQELTSKKTKILSKFLLKNVHVFDKLSYCKLNTFPSMNRKVVIQYMEYTKKELKVVPILGRSHS